MEAVVIAGVARRVLDELLKNPYRTIELRSAKNVIGVEKALSEALKLFLTYDPFEDVRVGTEGLLAEPVEVKEVETRIPWRESDEREVTVCRVKLRLLGFGRISGIEKGEIIRAEVREFHLHEANMG